MGFGKSDRAWQGIFASGVVTLAACALDNRRFDASPAEPLVPIEAGAAGAISEDPARGQTDGAGGTQMDDRRPDASMPSDLNGGSGVCSASNAESCPPLPICGDAGATCAATCPGCLIAGECFGPDALAPDNPCQICDPTRDPLAWSNRDGSECNDNLFCTTGDICREGRCEGAPFECEDGVACNGVSTCLEESDACSADVNQCANGSLCSVAARACVTTCTGCLIAGVCVEPGAEEAGNPCRICAPERSGVAYSAAVGKSCGAGPSACSQQDTCNEQGACRPNDLPAGAPCGDSSSNACDQADACDGSGSCQPRRAPNDTPCDDGQFCSARDRCQGGGCIGSGATCSANQSCSEGSNQCVCSGGTLSCTPREGPGPNCASWDFESGMAEGWEFDAPLAGSADAHFGQLTSSTAVPAPRGSRSLAMRFQGTGSPGRTTIYIRVPLCASGNFVSLAGKRVQALVRLVTDPGTNPLTSGQGHLVTMYSGEEFPRQGGDFSADPETGGGDGPLGWDIVDVNLDEQFTAAGTTVSHFGFRFIVDTVWSGTIYLDDVRIL